MKYLNNHRGHFWDTVLIAAAGVLTGGLSLVGAGLMVASSAYLDRQQRKAQQKAANEAAAEAAAQMASLSQMTQAPAMPMRVIYGKNVKVSGDMIFRDMQGVNTYYIVIAVAAHSLKFKHDLYVDDTYCASTDFTLAGN